MLRYFDNSFKSQLEKLRLDCDHFTESEDEISDRVEQGIIAPVSSENCNLTVSNVYSDLSHFTGSGSISSGSAKSVSTFRSESRLEESLSSASFPGSPKPGGGVAPIDIGIAGTAVRGGRQATSPFVVSSKSEESLYVQDNSTYGYVNNDDYDANDYNELILDPPHPPSSQSKQAKTNPLTTSSIVRR